MNTYSHCNHCFWVGCILFCIGWWLVSSGLLMLSWNKVICAYTKLKPAKYWQALLLVGTVAVLIAPLRHHSERWHHHRWGMHRECPYPHDPDADADQGPDEVKPAPEKK